MPTAVRVLSVVVPMYDEEEVLPIFFERMHPLLDGLGISYEVVVVDDGSRDATAALLNEAVKTWPELRLVRLLRNSGHQAALSAGFRLARGEYLVTIDADLQDPPEVIAELLARGEYLVSIDADLQDPPEVIAELLAAARDSDVDVVYGVRSDRSSDTWAKRTTARLYYRLMCRLVGREIPFDAGDFRLVSRRVVDAVNALPEDGRVFRLVIPWLGFPSAEVRYVRAERAAGVTKYNLRKMLGLAFDSVTAFSAAPLRLATWLGLFGGLLSVAFVIGALVIKLTGQSIPGWTSTVLAVAVIGAIQLLCLGLLGEYVARLFQFSQKRPQFLVGYDSLEDPGHHTYAEALESSDPEQR